ncbi:hypothetical protein ARMSODRAFT_1009265 [Armillaria solidipes]|uniref:Fungal N-terminal domain-containing protein n=1 Tax=Armillaria solidipes TaxID=1076256 RepID=A0A2H3AP11_9AGAR|nr:hypothetical protein ARMSODRAFT_1009265 [Armillaria solidipes]
MRCRANDPGVVYKMNGNLRVWGRRIKATTYLRRGRCSRHRWLQYGKRLAHSSSNSRQIMLYGRLTNLCFLRRRYLITMPTNTSRKPRHGSKAIPASIQIANIVKGPGDMVPIVGGFVRGIAETAGVLFENLEQSKNNKEDMQDLAEEIIEIVKLIHDAGIQASATPEGIKYTSSLQTACLEFQESYLSDVLTQVNEISRNKGGVRGKIVDVLASRDIKEDIGRHRKAVGDARKNFDVETQLSLNILQVSLKTLQVVTRNTGAISRVDERLSSLQSTSAMTVPAKLATNNTRSPVNSETQRTGQSYRSPAAEDFKELNSGASFGYYLTLCKERLLQLHAFNGAAPWQHASYMVAWHQSHRVRMIGFSEVGPARAVYNAVSTKWAKVLIDRLRSRKELLSDSGGRWIMECKEEVLRRPLLQDSISPSRSWPYIVAFHHQDRVRMIGLSIEGCARVVYAVISTKLAKILMNTRRSEVLMSHGYNNYAKECGEEVRRLDALQSAIPLQSASYIVAFHQNTCVRMLGFSEERAARAVYGAVSIHWAKVLMDRRNSGKSLASHGYAYYVQQCEEEVLRNDFQEPT